MNIRLIKPDEYSELAELSALGFRAAGYVDEDYELELRDVAGRVANSEVLVALDTNGRLLGGVTFISAHPSPYSEFDHENTAGVRMLSVHPGARGQDVSEALVQACIDRAKELGRSAIIAHSGTLVRAAHRVYDRLGFERDPNLDWWPLPGIELLGFRLNL
ncbi:MAG: GNAT family N-acetyltransferase [Acidimicrobiia bacterium]